MLPRPQGKSTSWTPPPSHLFRGPESGVPQCGPRTRHCRGPEEQQPLSLSVRASPRLRTCSFVVLGRCFWKDDALRTSPNQPETTESRSRFVAKCPRRSSSFKSRQADTGCARHAAAVVVIQRQRKTTGMGLRRLPACGLHAPLLPPSPPVFVMTARNAQQLSPQGQIAVSGCASDRLKVERRTGDVFVSLDDYPQAGLASFCPDPPLKRWRRTPWLGFPDRSCDPCLPAAGVLVKWQP